MRVALTGEHPGLWWFGLFNEPFNRAYNMMAGKEKVWLFDATPTLEVVKGAVTQCDIAVWAHFLEQPGHLRASIEWFSTLPRDVKDDAIYEQTKLTMPVLALGGSASLGGSVADASAADPDQTGSVNNQIATLSFDVDIAAGMPVLAGRRGQP